MTTLIQYNALAEDSEYLYFPQGSFALLGEEPEAGFQLTVGASIYILPSHLTVADFIDGLESNSLNLTPDQIKSIKALVNDCRDNTWDMYQDEDAENLPQEVKSLIEQYGEPGALSSKEIGELVKDLNGLGYYLEYGLEANPHIVVKLP